MKSEKIKPQRKSNLGLLITFLVAGILFNAKAQTSNITTNFNLDKGALEISFDLAGPENSNWNINVALEQKKDGKFIIVPNNNLNKSLRGLNPGRHMFEISFADLQIEGDFSTKIEAYSSNSATPQKPIEISKSPLVATKPTADLGEEMNAEAEGVKLYAKKSKKREAAPTPTEVDTEESEKAAAPTLKVKQKIVTKNIDPEPEEANEYIPEDNISVESKIPSNSTSNSRLNKVIRGFMVKGTSISDLSNKIKQASSELMILSDLTPVNLILDIKKLTFKCDFVANNSNISKIGLYFGPKSTGCESCVNVVINNPGSSVLLKGSNSSFDYELIGIKRD